MFEMMEHPVSTLPDGMADLAPGVGLMGLLAGVHRDFLSDFDRIELLKARSRLRAHVDAELLADMVSVLDAESGALSPGLAVDEVHEAAAAEIQAALSWTRRMAERQLDFASTLVSDYPAVWEMLHGGLLDLPRVRVIVDHTCHLQPAVRDQVVETVLEKASSQTTGLLAARIRRLAIWVAPESARESYENGVQQRRVVTDANPDGTANLSGFQLPPELTQAAARRINRMADELKRSGDSRSIDQIRADIFLDLLKGNGLSNGGGDRGVVDIQVGLTTLLQLDEQPGEIPGWGPVISDIARQVVEEQIQAEWRYTITSDDNGTVISNGTTRRRPGSGLKRQVQAQTPVCVFPGCRIPSLDCDLDHNQPWAENGPTSGDNLAPLCRHHHVIRHHGWTIHQTQPGSYQLTSPLGHSYTSQPRAP